MKRAHPKHALVVRCGSPCPGSKSSGLDAMHGASPAKAQRGLFGTPYHYPWPSQQPVGLEYTGLPILSCDLFEVYESIAVHEGIWDHNIGSSSSPYSNSSMARSSLQACGCALGLQPKPHGMHFTKAYRALIAGFGWGSPVERAAIHLMIRSSCRAPAIHVRVSTSG